jgi:hypothetical protein
MAGVNIKQLVESKIGRINLVRPVNIYPYMEHIKRLANESHIAIGIKYNGEAVNLVCVNGKIIGYSNLIGFKYLCIDRKIDFSNMVIYQAEMLGDTFFIYDLVYMNGKLLVTNNVTYKERFALITEVPLICGKYRAQRRFLLFDRFTQKLISKFLLMLTHTKIPNDGAIIYCGITHIIYTDLCIYKYKPRHELTVDLLMKGSKIYTYADKGHNQFVELTGFNIIDDKKVGVQNACNEFRFSNDNKSVIITRPRPDRTAPNRKFIVEATYGEFKNYIHMKDIIQRLGLKIQEDYDDDRLDSRSYALKKKFNFFAYETHKIKAEILEKQSGVILDCGFGQGADYSKYKGNIKKFYAIEPNMDNIYRGVTERKDFKDLMDVDIKTGKLELIFEFAQCIIPIVEKCDFINFMFSFTYFFKTRNYFNAMMDIIRGSSKITGESKIDTKDTGASVVNILTFDGEKYCNLKNNEFYTVQNLNKDCDKPGFGRAFHTDLIFSKTAKNIHEYGVYKSMMIEEFKKNGFDLADFKDTKDFKFKIEEPYVKAYADTVVNYTFVANRIPCISLYKDILPSIVTSLFNTDIKTTEFDNYNLDVISACKFIKSKFIHHKLDEYKLDWKNVCINNEDDINKATLIATFITNAIVDIKIKKDNSKVLFTICDINFV